MKNASYSDAFFIRFNKNSVYIDFAIYLNYNNIKQLFKVKNLYDRS